MPRLTQRSSRHEPPRRGRRVVDGLPGLVRSALSGRSHPASPCVDGTGQRAPQRRGKRARPARQPAPRGRRPQARAGDPAGGENCASAGSAEDCGVASVASLRPFYTGKFKSKFKFALNCESPSVQGPEADTRDDGSALAFSAELLESATAPDGAGPPASRRRSPGPLRAGPVTGSPKRCQSKVGVGYRHQ